MKRLLVILTSAAFVVISTPSQATLLLYDPFDYTAGERLGGSGTSPLGQIAPNGQQWITRSPAGGGSYNPLYDTLITGGNLSYPGLAPSYGNSVRYGTSTAGNTDPLYTDAIALPSTVTEGSLYYSAIVKFNGPNIQSGGRNAFTSFSTETANPATDAGLGLNTSSGTGNIAMPAGAWIRNSGTLDYHLGSGKANSDGMGPSLSLPSWQSSAAGHPYPNQQGNTSGAGQDKATIDQDLYFMVLKYTFDPNNAVTGDTVSMWINPISTTLGYDAGEALAGAAGGSYYSAVNATVTATTVDASQIESFILLGLTQQSARTDKSIDISLDELRIGTTWADVTPVPEPGVLTLLGLGLAGLLCLRRRA